VRLNNQRVEDAAREVTPADLASATTLVLQVGKKRHYLARFR
jgi:tyrosyl-tRNA synthetase